MDLLCEAGGEPDVAGEPDADASVEVGEVDLSWAMGGSPDAKGESYAEVSVAAEEVWEDSSSNVLQAIEYQ